MTPYERQACENAANKSDDFSGIDDLLDKLEYCLTSNNSRELAAMRVKALRYDALWEAYTDLERELADVREALADKAQEVRALEAEIDSLNRHIGGLP